MADRCGGQAALTPENGSGDSIVRITGTCPEARWVPPVKYGPVGDDLNGAQRLVTVTAETAIPGT